MNFEIIGEIAQVETIATGSKIREIARLRKIYGPGRWRKRKGICRIRLADGALELAEILVRGKRNWPQRIQDQGATRKRTAMNRTAAKQLVVCIQNEDYAASLEKRKIYVALRDDAAEAHGLLRIVDESVEDYLYPKSFFRPIELPQAVKRAVLSAA